MELPELFTFFIGLLQEQMSCRFHYYEEVEVANRESM
jgi:hypothetical protein